MRLREYHYKKRDFIKIFDVKENINKINNPINIKDLKKVVNNFLKFPHHSISLTGGEPLLYTDFLIDFLPENVYTYNFAPVIIVVKLKENVNTGGEYYEKIICNSSWLRKPWCNIL